MRLFVGHWSAFAGWLECWGEDVTHVFDQSPLVLKGISLAEMVQFVVEVLVDLARGTVLDEEAAQDAETAHPEDLAGKESKTHNQPPIIIHHILPQNFQTTYPSQIHHIHPSTNHPKNPL